MDSPAGLKAPVRPEPRQRLAARQRWVIAGMVGFIALLNLVGWGLLIGVIAPHQYSLGAAGVFGVGLGVTAFTLGMRHAFDADHIAAIDNTTRTLVARGQQPVSVGFWFSLGHSSVVFALCFLLAVGVRSLASEVVDDRSTLTHLLGLVGTTVSGLFLLLVGVVNLVLLVRILRVARGLRTGTFQEHELEQHLASRGFLNRILGGVSKAVRKPRHMYLVGLLFGLGFDTATEVSLLVLAGGAAAFALPWYAILVLPVLFAAGMTLLDTADGTFMNYAYGWASDQPLRKVFYNIVVTALSVAVALIIGTIELVSILADRIEVMDGPVRWVADVDMDKIGFVIVGVFVATWVIALLVWRFARIEERWSSPVTDVG